jgi:hypothetical protein
MSNKDYKKGMEAGARPFQDKLEKFGRKIAKLGIKIDGGLDTIYDALSASEIEELYGLKIPSDLIDLDEKEKHFLLACLYQLSSDSSKTNDLQQTFIRSLQSYLRITNSQMDADYSKIENIESVSTIKAFMQVFMEFLFLEKGNDSFLKKYKNVLEYFNITVQGRSEILADIKKYYKAAGSKGIAEKYAFYDIIKNASEKKNISNQTVENQNEIEEIMTDIETASANERIEYSDYKELRDLILDSAKSLCNHDKVKPIINEKNDPEFSKEISKFINLNQLNCSRETILALIKFPVTEGNDNGMLLTTYGFYLKKALSNVAAIPYRDIMEFSEIRKEKNKSIIVSIKEQERKNKDSNNKIREYLESIGTLKFKNIIKDNKLIIDNKYLDTTKFLRLIDDIKKLPEEEMPQTDSPISISSMTTEIKELFLTIVAKFLYNENTSFPAECSAQLLRLVNEYQANDADIPKILNIIKKDIDISVGDLVKQLVIMAPHGSKTSLIITLLQECVRILVSARSNYREKRIVLNVGADEYKFLSSIGKYIMIDDKMLDKLIPFAQIPERILAKDIKRNEINKINKIYLSTFSATGISILAILGYYGFVWTFIGIFNFIMLPGIGAVLSIAALVNMIIGGTFILKEKKSNDEKDEILKDDEKISNKRNVILKEYIASLERTIEMMKAQFVDLTDEITYLRDLIGWADSELKGSPKKLKAETKSKKLT